jgi:DNA-binding beta-propeller fold protein YncE
MATIVVVAAVTLLLSLRSPAAPGRVSLAGLSGDSTTTVGFAGAFPPEGEPLLSNPLGIVWDGERLYVAESDAGVVRVFDESGGNLGTIVLPVAGDATAVYPSVMALADDRLAIVDNASSRVIVIDAAEYDANGTAEVLLTIGSGDDSPVQPTSVAYADGEYFVADAADGLVKVYDAQGALVRSIGEDLRPQLTYVGWMALDERGLIVADSNAGRVLVIDPATGAQRAVFADRYTLPRAVVPLGSTAVAVVDAFERAVSLTDAEGVRTESIDAQSVPQAPLASPRGAAWHAEDARLYVTDATGGRVIVFNVRLP